MEPYKYYLWSTRAGAWMTNGGTYSSDRGQARVVEHAEAIELAKVHRGMGGEFGLLPISIEMLKEIK